MKQVTRDFQKRSLKLERIDTGDYTSEEYERFLQEIRLVNRFAGDTRALKKSLIREIRKSELQSFSVLDVGAGSGELLRVIAGFARKTKRRTNLCGVELNSRSADAILEESQAFGEISSVQTTALDLPFADKSFDYGICSLFTHHFTDENVIKILRELARVSRRKIFVIDLHRHRMAYFFYQLFCAGLRISPLVREDGSLSILRAFVPVELEILAERADLKNVRVSRCLPFRLVLEAEGSN